jgi:hypothetical protein
MICENRYHVANAPDNAAKRFVSGAAMKQAAQTLVNGASFRRRGRVSFPGGNVYRTRRENRWPIENPPQRVEIRFRRRGGSIQPQ